MICCLCVNTNYNLYMGVYMNYKYVKWMFDVFEREEKLRLFARKKCKKDLYGQQIYDTAMVTVGLPFTSDDDSASCKELETAVCRVWKDGRSLGLVFQQEVYERQEKF